MGVAYNPKIVTDGLVLCLDAANPKSYPGNGTKWSDLSSNGNDGTLVNGVGFSSENNGAMVFDGVDDYVFVNHDTKLNPTLSMTVSTWVKVSNFKSNMSIFGKGTSNSGFDFRIDSSTQLNLVKYSVVDQRLSVPQFITNVWYSIAAVQSTDRVDYYINGNFQGTFLDTRQFITNQSELIVGRDRHNIYFSGIIANTFFYNKVLTPEEIQQNYNALKGRYGL